MPELLTRADAIRRYLSGAASDGGAQTNHNLCLGNYRSSTEVAGQGCAVTNPIANLTVDYVSPLNRTGTATLRAVTSDTVAFTGVNGAEGAAVSIANGESKLIEDGGTSGKFARVSRTSATALSGTATLTVSDPVNNVIGLDNVSSAEAVAGDDEYRAYFLRNVGAVSIENHKVWIGTLASQAVSDGGQLGASGSGTLVTTGSLADWPASGWVHIKNGASTREIAYYTSRTDTTLTIPAAGRSCLGTSAAAGAASDTLDSVPGIRFATEAPAPLSNGPIQTIGDEDTAPTGTFISSWDVGITAGTGLTIGTLAAGESYAVWIHREIRAGSVATAAAINLLRRSWDGA